MHEPKIAIRIIISQGFAPAAGPLDSLKASWLLDSVSLGFVWDLFVVRVLYRLLNRNQDTWDSSQIFLMPYNCDMGRLVPAF